MPTIAIAAIAFTPIAIAAIMGFQLWNDKRKDWKEYLAFMERQEAMGNE